MVKCIKEYDVKADKSHRVTLRNPQYQAFHVMMYEDGRIILEPHKATEPPQSEQSGDA